MEQGGTQDDEIAQLRNAMKEAQLKAKERIKQKNQSLKEMEDIVTTLTSEMEDLRREKDKLNNRLLEENERANIFVRFTNDSFAKRKIGCPRSILWP